MHLTQTLSVGQVLLQIPEQLHFSNLVSSIQQETSESVVVAVVIAEETSNWQVDSHSVPSVEVDSHNNGGTVLLVLHIFLPGSGHHLAVNLQTSAGGQGVARRTGVTVDGEGKAVDARSRNGEDTCLHVVAIAKIDEDMTVGDHLVVTVGAVALQFVVVGECDREGAAAGWRCSEKEKPLKLHQEKLKIGLHDRYLKCVEKSFVLENVLTPLSLLVWVT